MRLVGAWLVLALVALPCLALAPAAQAQTGPTLDYEVRLLDPTTNTVRVSVVASGLPSAPFELRFALPVEPQDVRNASFTNGALVAEPADGAVSLSFEVPLAARAFAFAMVRLESSLPRPANATIFDAPPTVALVGPEGWGVLAPAGDEGLAVFARDLRNETRTFGHLRATVASTTPIPDELWDLLRHAFPHVSAQHGAGPSEILVVRSPPGAVSETLIASPSLALPADASDEEVARGLVRLHQRYRVVEVAPASASWLREGEERYHTLTALLAANATTTEEVQLAIERARAAGDRAATLPQSPAGSVASRQKGLVVVHALDDALRNASQGRVGLADLLEELDAAATSETRIDSADVEAAAERVAGAPLDAFFQAYVYGAEWPDPVPVANGADIFVRSLRAEPPRAAPGEQVVAAFDAVNRGTRAGAVELLVTLDGVAAGSTRVELEVGERAKVGTPVVAIVPGDHEVEVAGLRATFRVLEAAALALDRASATPAEPIAGEPFTLLVYVRNDGETGATARLEVRENALLLQRTTEARVEGGATRAITLPMRLDVAGLHALEVELISDAGGGLLTHEVNVGAGDPAERGAPAPHVALAIGLALVLQAMRGRMRKRGD